MTREKRTFTDDEVISALALLRANGDNMKRTAVQLGISRTTLRGWAGKNVHQNGQPKQVDAAKVSEKSAKLADTLDRIAEKLSARIEEAADNVPIVTSMDLRNVLVSNGITIEKASFARGGPTSRVESLRVSLIDPASLRSGTLQVIEGGKKAKSVA